MAKAKKQQKDLTFEVLRAALFTKCRELGVTSISVDFDGSGDDGSVQDSHFEGLKDPKLAETTMVSWLESGHQEFTGKGFKYVQGAVKEMSLQRAFEQYCYDVLERHCPGDWINNDGGYGTLVFKTLEPPYDVKLEYHQRMSSTMDYEIDAETGKVLKEEGPNES